MVFSKITMYVAGGKYQCKIEHDGKKAISAWHRYASDAYRAARSKLVYGPGYVQMVPRTEYVTDRTD